MTDRQTEKGDIHMILQIITKTPSGYRQEILQDNITRVQIFTDAVTFLQHGELLEVEFEEDDTIYLLNDKGKTLRKLK